MATRNQSDFQTNLQYLGVTLVETNISLEDFNNSLVLKINNPSQFTSIIERLEQKMILKCKSKFILIAIPIVYIDFETVIDDLNDKTTLQADLTMGFKNNKEPVVKPVKISRQKT